MNPSDQARQIGVVDSWLGQYRSLLAASAPEAGTVLADTGQLVAGHYEVFAFYAADAALGWNNLYFAWRNAANNAALWGIRILSPGATFNSFLFKGVKVAANERFRFTVDADFAGKIDTSIIAVRRA